MIKKISLYKKIAILIIASIFSNSVTCMNEKHPTTNFDKEKVNDQLEKLKPVELNSIANILLYYINQVYILKSFKREFGLRTNKKENKAYENAPNNEKAFIDQIYETYILNINKFFDKFKAEIFDHHIKFKNVNLNDSDIQVYNDDINKNNIIDHYNKVLSELIPIHSKMIEFYKQLSNAIKPTNNNATKHNKGNKNSTNNSNEIDYRSISNIVNKIIIFYNNNKEFYNSFWNLLIKKININENIIYTKWCTEDLQKECNDICNRLYANDEDKKTLIEYIYESIIKYIYNDILKQCIKNYHNSEDFFVSYPLNEYELDKQLEDNNSYLLDAKKKLIELKEENERLLIERQAEEKEQARKKSQKEKEKLEKEKKKLEEKKLKEKKRKEKEAKELYDLTKQIELEKKKKKEEQREEEKRKAQRIYEANEKKREEIKNIDDIIYKKYIMYMPTDYTKYEHTYFNKSVNNTNDDYANKNGHTKTHFYHHYSPLLDIFTIKHGKYIHKSHNNHQYYAFGFICRQKTTRLTEVDNLKIDNIQKYGINKGKNLNKHNTLDFETVLFEVFLNKDGICTHRGVHTLKEELGKPNRKELKNHLLEFKKIAKDKEHLSNIKDNDIKDNLIRHFQAGTDQHPQHPLYLYNRGDNNNAIFQEDELFIIIKDEIEEARLILLKDSLFLFRAYLNK